MPHSVKSSTSELVKFFNSIKVIPKTAFGCPAAANTFENLFKLGDKFCLCLVSGDKRCSLNKLKKKLSKKEVSMASHDEVKQITGYTIGGVSPIGHLVNTKVYMDKHLERFSKVFAAAGHPNAVFGITFIELKKLTNSEVDDLTEWGNQN